MEANSNVQKPKLWGSCRLTYALCAFLSNVVNVSMTSSLNLAILCMQSPENDSNATKSIDFKYKCGEAKDQHSQSATYNKHGELTWSKDQQWYFLGCYYYGLMLMQPIAGRFIDKFGAKKFLLGAMMLEAVLFCLIPTIARRSYVMASSARVLQGLVAAFIPCSIYKLFVSWGHIKERQGLVAVANCGTYFGALVIFPITSLLCQIGWAYVFYSIGAGAALLSIVLLMFVYDTIDDHPRISTEEYDYLKTNNLKGQEAEKVPWKSLFTSSPVLAFIITHFCNAYGFIMTILYLPRFYKEELNFSVRENGIFMSFIYIGLLITNILISLFINKLFDLSQLSLTNFRKLGLVIGDSILIILYLAVCVLPCEKRLIIVIIFLFVGCAMGFSFSGGYWPTALDLAPAYAGLIVGVANSAANLDGVMIPSLLTNTVLGEKGSRHVFYSIAFMQLMSILVYGIFGSSERQSFA